MNNLNKITTLTLAAGDTFFNDDIEKKFFYNSLISAKKIFFENSGIFKNYFLVSNDEIYRENNDKNIIYNKKIINYGSLGSLIYFLNKVDSIPQRLVVNYVDKKISTKDFERILKTKDQSNIISALQAKQHFSQETKESFDFREKTYIFNGVLMLNKKSLVEIKNLKKEFYYNNIPYLFNGNILESPNFEILENIDEILELREKIDIAKIILGSKSKSLTNLRDIKLAKIPEFITIKKSEIGSIDKAIRKLEDELIIRSDSESEDSFTESNAGKFLSIGPVHKKNKKELNFAIRKVFNSYLKSQGTDKVIVQNFVKNIKSSGVITTRLLGNSSPYYCLSISDSSNSDEVTSGNTNKIKNIYIHKNIEKLEGKLKKYQYLLDFVNELIKVINYELLDIEFAVDKNKNIYLLQVRPLLVGSEPLDYKKGLIKSIRKFQQLQNKRPNTYGSKTILSNMSDWNPAEMLGESPNNLAISLYKTFITKDTWHKQRGEFGYRGEVNQELMFNFGNKCFIDIRASLNSFLTKSLSSEECERIVDFQINSLIDNPEYHDKIEFEIAQTSYIFNLEHTLPKIYKEILSKQSSLNWVNDLKSIESNYTKILKQNNLKISKFYKHLNKNINYLDPKTVNAIKKNMALPFAHHARLAFIYFSQLNYFVSNEIISQEDKQDMLNRLTTISSQFTKSLYDLKNKKITYSKFFDLYGHIRPNNYDINSKSIVDEGKDFVNFLIDNLEKEEDNFNNIKDTLVKIEKFFVKAGLSYSSKEWHKMFENSIISRENSKFMYSKAIDMTLKHIQKSNEFDYNNLERLDFGLLLKDKKIIYQDQPQDYELPDVLINSNDFLFFENLNTKPNFVGQNSTKAKVIIISENKTNQLKNKIVLLPNADPGWDWIFNLSIKGLVTKYGGPNSHMAIRASEKNITSVFGTGEELFNQIKNSNLLEIDPKNKKLYLN